MKKTIGIISIVLFLLIEFQSCAAGIGNALDNSSEVSGSAGAIVGFLMLIGGIITLTSKEHKGMLITAIVLYVLAFVIGIANVGRFSDLRIWSILNIIFAALLGYHFYKNKELYK